MLAFFLFWVLPGLVAAAITAYMQWSDGRDVTVGDALALTVMSLALGTLWAIGLFLCMLADLDLFKLSLLKGKK